MSRRLPAVRRFSSSVSATKLIGNPRVTVGAAQSYLLARGAALSAFTSADDLGEAAYADPDGVRYLSVHLRRPPLQIAAGGEPA